MTRFDRGFAAVFTPEISERYFHPRPAARPTLDAQTFNLPLAWWLAELSRLCYARDPGEIGGTVADVGRDHWLGEVGLAEVATLERSPGHLSAIVVDDAHGAVFGQGGARCVVFRGTDSMQDWYDNFRAVQVAMRGNGQVHAGFLSVLDLVWTPLLPWVTASPYPLLITGHSLGGALAALCATRLAELSIAFAACYTFGAPALGDLAFATSTEKLNIHRVVHHLDMVAMLPVSLGHVRWEHAGKAWYCLPGGRCLGPLCEPDLDSLRQQEGWRLDAFALTRLMTGIGGQGVEVPEFISDHAPVNYTAAVEAAIAATT
ncbi:MAG: lipase family protein [Gammaproteobacteria bacterium]|nr:lipase family protein [Gammaproteobacteria bacterium]